MQQRVLAGWLVVLAACGGGMKAPDTGDDADDGGDDDATVDAPPAGDPVEVVAFDDAHVYFTPENHREVDAEVAFPAAGQSWKKVTLHLGLACPTTPGGCDPWDRLARLSLVDGDRLIEVARFITPYHIGGDFTVDVTDLQRLFEGTRTMRAFVDTWVGPGSGYGDGWLVSARFVFEPGVASPEPFAAIPLWAPGGVVYGDPTRPTARNVTVDVPAGATSARVRALVTGHGQGNLDNCAEFCPKMHTITAGADTVPRMLWRDDCPETAVPNQEGTWMYPRTGWCPGAMVTPWVADVAAPTGSQMTVGWDVEEFENTCRPDSPVCAGCEFNTGCNYNDSSHTEPRWELSGVLVLLR